MKNFGLAGTVNLAAGAWSKSIVGRVNSGGKFASCNKPGIYLIAIDNSTTVSDFPKVNGVPVYSYGMMIVTVGDPCISQLYISHRGHVAVRQSWNSGENYQEWFVQYSSANKPSAADIGALPITGGKLNGVIQASGFVASQGDGRQHFALADDDGQPRAWIYKDKGGDGIHINNGYDGGGEWILNKSGGMYCPGTISSYLEHTIRHTGYGRINFLHQSTGDYIFLETTQDGKGIYFVQRNQGNQNQWVLNFPQKNGIVATTDDIASTNNIPVGVPLPWPQNKPPTGYLICNGDRFDKAKYPQLALAYPSGELPDLRSEFIRGLDAGRNIDSGRNVLSFQEQSIQSHVHSGVLTGAFERESAGRGGWGAVNTNGNTAATGGNETRPRNIAFLYIVKAA